MIKKALVPLANGFEEIEAVTVMDILRRAGLEVVVAGMKECAVVGSREIHMTADVLFEAIRDKDFDLIVLPGGQPGVDRLRADRRLLDLLQKWHGQKKLIGAICAAPLILRDAGLVSGVHLTSYPSVRSQLGDSRYSEERVVVDGNIVTSRAPGTAMEFALTLVEILLGKEKSSELARSVLAPYGVTQRSAG